MVEAFSEESIQAWLSSGIRLARAVGRGQVLVVVPFEFEDGASSLLESEEHDVELVRPPGTYDVSSGRLEWTVRAQVLVFAGPLLGIHNRMLVQAARRGVKRVVHPEGEGWRVSWVLALLAKRTRGLAELSGGPLCRRWRWFEDRVVPLEDSAGVLDLIRDYRRHAGTAPVPRPLVLFACASLAPGGAERQLLLHIEGIRDSSEDAVAFLGLEVADDFHRPWFEARNIEVVDVSRRPALAAMPGTDLPHAALGSLDGLSPILGPAVLACMAEIRRMRPRVVHAWLDRAGIVVGLAAVLAGVPRVVIAQGSVAPVHFPLYRPYLRTLWRALAERPDVELVNNCAAGARSYEAWLGLPPGRIRVIRNGIAEGLFEIPDAEQQLAFRKEQGIPATAPVLGGVFRLGPEKGVQRWMETAALLAAGRPELHLLVVGDGPLCEWLEERSAAVGLGARFHRLDPRPDVRLPMAVMDVQLLASPFEGGPNVLLESQALGVPVVTCAAGGARETFLPGETGSFEPSLDPAALARSVEVWLDDPERRARVRRRGPDFIAESFGRARMIRETLEVYRA